MCTFFKCILQIALRVFGVEFNFKWLAQNFRVFFRPLVPFHEILFHFFFNFWVPNLFILFLFNLDLFYFHQNFFLFFRLSYLFILSKWDSHFFLLSADHFYYFGLRFLHIFLTLLLLLNPFFLFSLSLLSFHQLLILFSSSILHTNIIYFAQLFQSLL